MAFWHRGPRYRVPLNNESVTHRRYYAKTPVMLDGKIVIVTGVSRGIGKGIAPESVSIGGYAAAGNCQRWVQRFLPCLVRWPASIGILLVRTGAWTRPTLESAAVGITSIVPSTGVGQMIDAYVSPARDTVAARRFFERAVDSSGTTRRRVITDKAASYPPALAAIPVT